MIKLVFDTNVILDYFGILCHEDDQKEVVELVSELVKRSTPFLVTPSSLKDFHYLFCAALKKQVRRENGELAHKDARAIRSVCTAAMESLMDVATVASEDLGSCEMARALSKSHADFEDNLIAAVALRVNATAIVTRDKAFSKHAPVACCTPAQAVDFIHGGVWS